MSGVEGDSPRVLLGDLKAVSYTHLTPSAPTARAGRRMPRATGSAFPTSRRIQATGRIPITSRLRVSAVTSVSYTHLEELKL